MLTALALRLLAVMNLQPNKFCNINKFDEFSLVEHFNWSQLYLYRN